jgi:hypothetical protein
MRHPKMKGNPKMEHDREAECLESIIAELIEAENAARQARNELIGIALNTDRPEIRQGALEAMARYDAPGDASGG